MDCRPLAGRGAVGAGADCGLAIEAGLRSLLEEKSVAVMAAPDTAETPAIIARVVFDMAAMMMRWKLRGCLLVFYEARIHGDRQSFGSVLTDQVVRRVMGVWRRRVRPRQPIAKAVIFSCYSKLARFNPKYDPATRVRHSNLKCTTRRSSCILDPQFATLCLQTICFSRIEAGSKDLQQCGLPQMAWSL